MPQTVFTFVAILANTSTQVAGASMARRRITFFPGVTNAGVIVTYTINQVSPTGNGNGLGANVTPITIEGRAAQTAWFVRSGSVTNLAVVEELDESLQPV